MRCRSLPLAVPRAREPKDRSEAPVRREAGSRGSRASRIKPLTRAPRVGCSRMWSPRARGRCRSSSRFASIRTGDVGIRIVVCSPNCRHGGREPHLSGFAIMSLLKRARLLLHRARCWGSRLSGAIGNRAHSDHPPDHLDLSLPTPKRDSCLSASSRDHHEAGMRSQWIASLLSGRVGAEGLV